jgi:glycosyltransferase involved in cell wall biosynthesis
MRPKVSVIIPVYNRFDLLKQVVESILAQTLPVYELILIDDGSIDNTSQELPRYVEQNSRWKEKVRYFHQLNQGQAAAGNHGIRRATGDWLAFNANDDLWLPQKLEWQFKALEQFPDCQVCFTDAWFMNNSRMKMTLFQLAGRNHPEPLGIIPEPLRYVLDVAPPLGLHPVWVQTMVARADLVNRLNGMDVTLRYGEDDDFVFRLACESKFCYVSVPMVLIDRTPPEKRHTGVGSNFDKQTFRLEMNRRRFEKRLQLSQSLPPEVAEAARESLRGVHSELANCFLREREYARAREALSRAAEYRSTPNLLLKRALARLAPNLARKIVLRREAAFARATVGMG